MGVKIFYKFYCEATLLELRDTLDKIAKEIRNLDVEVIVANWNMDKKRHRIGRCLSGTIKGWNGKFHLHPRAKIKTPPETAILRWKSHDIAKTEWADDGIETHKLVIKLLDICKKYGIVKCVLDQGRYWQDRDEDFLKLKFQISRKAIISKIIELMKDGYEVQNFRGEVIADKGEWTKKGRNFLAKYGVWEN